MLWYSKERLNETVLLSTQNISVNCKGKRNIYSFTLKHLVYLNLLLLLSSLFQIGELEETKIPVSMTVVGCPLSFQMTAAQPDLKSVVRSVPYFNSVIVFVVSDRRT